jgi:hypothetical protein
MTDLLSSILYKYKFKRARLDEITFKDEPGVYIIACQTDKGPYTNIDVYESDNMKSDLENNQNKNKWYDKCSGYRSLEILYKYMPGKPRPARIKILQKIETCQM